MINKLMEIKVSIIIPLYNKESTIYDTILSVIHQTYQNIEIIIVDDGSTDKSVEVASTIKDDRIKMFHRQNGGVSSARNFGARQASGDWLMFLDADDELEKDGVSSLCLPIEECDSCGIICGNFNTDYHALKLPKSAQDCVIVNRYYNYFIRKYSLRTGNLIIRKNIFDMHPFNVSLSRFEDMEAIFAWLKLTRVYHVNKVIMTYHTKSNSLSKVVNNFEKDYISHLNFSDFPFWGKCILGEILYIGFIDYRDQRRWFLKNYRFNNFFALIAKVNLLIQHFL